MSKIIEKVKQTFHVKRRKPRTGMVGDEGDGNVSSSSSSSSSSGNGGDGTLGATRKHHVHKWRAGKAYSVGDRVSWDGQMYQCILAHTSAELDNPAVDTTHWMVGTSGGVTPVPTTGGVTGTTDVPVV